MSDHGGLTLASRFGLLQANRIALSLCAVAAAWTGIGAGSSLAPLAISYAVLTTALEYTRRHRRWRGQAIGTTLLILDVILIRLVIVSGQDPLGPYAFMSFVHVVGAMVLLPHRIGLRLAFTHGIMAFIFTSLRVAGIFGAPISSDGLRDLSVAIFGLVIVAVAMAVFGSAVERERTDRRREAVGLANLAKDLQDESDRATIAELLLAGAKQTLGFQTGAISLDPDAAGDLTETALVRDPRTLHPELSAQLRGHVNVVVVPLGRREDRQGVAAFVTGGDASTRIPGDLIALTEQFCSTASAALSRAALQAEIKRLATHDELTGLPNRRVFDDSLKRQVAEAERYGTACSLLVIDIDKFKDVNDNHGHAKGDEVLKHVGYVLRENIRGSDLAARFGGEEFVVLLPDGAVPKAAAAAEKLRARLGDGSGPLPFTVSIGVAVLPVHARTGATLFEAADAALYTAKKNGRNRVEIADGPDARQGTHAPQEGFEPSTNGIEARCSNPLSY